ncbi:histidine kinase N-terminal 7TM domain-containing protein [Halovenus rubra]|uniref:histidine kinase n=2 Tax=Halovenus rubra TaxID=869890 RepID=A0ABD5X2D3_9EURY|nr:histidine kinase N-terminal 7TM domain-containing protein [Halovenus rubra]
MVKTYPVASLLQFLTAGIVLALGVQALRQRRQRVSVAFVAMALGSTGWALSAGVSSAVADPELTYIFGFAVYPFTLFSSIGWFFLAAAHKGRNRLFRRPVLTAFATIWLLNVVALASNPLHHQFIDAATRIPESGIAEPVAGPLYWVFMLVTFSIFLAGVGLLAVDPLTGKGIHHRQTRVVMGGGLIPMLFALVEVSDVVPAPGLDLGVLGLTIGTGVLFYAVFYADFLKIVPIQQKTLLENMDDAIVALDTADRIVDLNPRATTFFDLSASAVGQDIDAALADKPELRAAIERAPASDDIEAAPSVPAAGDEAIWSDEFTVTKDGQQRHFALSVSAIETDRPGSWTNRTESRERVGRLVVVRDITTRRRRERRLQQYETVVETAGDPIFVLDEDGHIELLNDAMVDFLDSPREKLVGEHVGNFLDPESLSIIMESITHMALTGADAQQYKMERTGPDGETLHYEVNTRLIEDDVGDTNMTFGSVGVIRDVTTHVERKQELDLLNQILTRVLRHNIRNDLNVISGNAEILESRLAGSEAEIAQRIKQNAIDVIHLADEARTAQRVTNTDSERTRIALSEILRPPVENIKERYPDADLTVDILDCNVLTTKEMDMAVEQLLENAIVHNDDDPHVEVSATRHKTATKVTIADDGPGIDMSEVSVINEGEETDLSHGSGLGLWLITWIVNRSGATVEFANTEAGTQVTLTLPTQSSTGSGSKEKSA